MGAGNDFTITHDGDIGATIAGSPITITSAEASTWSTSSGALTITSAAAATWSTAAGVLTIDGDDGITLQTTGSGNVTVAEILDITDSTDSSDATGDTGALRTEGGASIAQKLYVGTNADMGGTLHADGAISGDSSLQVDGRAAIGNNAGVQPTLALHVNEIQTDPAGLTGIHSYTIPTLSSGANANAFQGFRVVNDLRGNQNYTETEDNAQTGNAGISVDMINRATATVTEMFGISTHIRKLSTGAVTTAAAYKVGTWGNFNSTNNIDTLSGLHITDPTATGTISTLYGIKIDDLDGAANNYGIYVENADTLSLWIDAGVSRFDGAISLGTDMGDDGQQLTSGGDDAACDWTAASSLREHKHIGKEADRNEALQAMLGSKAYHFQYRQKMGTGDSATEYVGLMADDAPWAMHYKGKIVNPVNTLGYTVLSIQALNDKIEKLEQELSEVRNVN
jgi:hypothetical protein